MESMAKIDMATIVFSRPRKKWELVEGTRQLIKNGNVFIKKDFNKFDEAITYLTKRKLGLDCNEDYDLWNFPDCYVWEPVRLTRRVYTPGKGTVVTTYPLEIRDG